MSWISALWTGLSLIWRIFLAVLVSIVAVAKGWKRILIFIRWCLEKHDVPVLEVIEKAGAICTVAFIARNLPQRSSNSIEKSIARLKKQGKIYQQAVGYVSIRMQKDIKNAGKLWDG